MHKRLGLFVLAASLAGCAGMSTHPPGMPAPEAVVPEIARQFSACDLDTLVGHYSPAIEFISPSTPQPLVGHTAIRRYFSGACQGRFRPVMRVEAQQVRLLSADAAVVTGRYSFGRTDRPDDTPWPAFFVITLRRDQGVWRIETQATFAIPEG
ncbi:DUF4440 domain-containing protein [Ideonella sp. A 288]|uniref:YybH family protein n=1 Tax=Ideonella sp. A 288 TaxID=1962181 RepID=UPI000B4AB8B0|nr:nuclear transport factor 2 family protein [Ideonella sp. A 288]